MTGKRPLKNPEIKYSSSKSAPIALKCHCYGLGCVAHNHTTKWSAKLFFICTAAAPNHSTCTQPTNAACNNNNCKKPRCMRTIDLPWPLHPSAAGAENHTTGGRTKTRSCHSADSKGSRSSANSQRQKPTSQAFPTQQESAVRSPPQGTANLPCQALTTHRHPRQGVLQARSTISTAAPLAHTTLRAHSAPQSAMPNTAAHSAPALCSCCMV